MLAVWTGWLAAIGALMHVFIAASFMSHSGILSLEGPVIVWVPATFFVWDPGGQRRPATCKIERD